MTDSLDAPPLRPAQAARTTLFPALRQAARQRPGGRSAPVVADPHSGAMSDAALIRASLALSRRIARRTQPGEAVALLLPTSVGAVIAFFALQACGRVAVLLNHTVGTRRLHEACRLARVSTIITSERFLRGAGLEQAAASLDAPFDLVTLEALRREIGPLDRAHALAGWLVPRLLVRRPHPDDTAVILFTSGTTGAAKGVALSHANLLANIAQCRQQLPFQDDWVVFNPMPVFHSLGLTCGTLLPLLGGMRVLLHPSPLEARRIVARIRDSDANVLIATDTFARLYARTATGKELSSLRLVALGGEPMQEETRRRCAARIGGDVLQGYGATECAPVIAFNRPGRERRQSVGELLPGMQARLVAVEGVDRGQRLLVRGPNLMRGYLDPEAAGGIEPAGDWFDTGDLASIDDDGFITITGRVKRFAKVGGEMVSLDAVEGHARGRWPDASHATVIDTSTAQGGERIVLVTEQRDASRDTLAAYLREQDAPTIEVPHRIFVVRQVPLTATGSPDYESVRDVVRERTGGGRAGDDERAADGDTSPSAANAASGSCARSSST